MIPAVRRGPGRHRPWPLCRQCYGLALDVGGTRTRAWTSDRGTILDVPTATGSGTGEPVRRSVVDSAGTARLLGRLFGDHEPGAGGRGRPLVIVSAPVLGGVAHRDRVRAAVEVLRPRAVLTVPAARAVAVAARADLSRPLLVVDLGARLTEVVLLADGAVVDARGIALGTGDVDGGAPGTRGGGAPGTRGGGVPDRVPPGALGGDGTVPSAAPPADLLVDAVTVMVTAMLEEDRTPRTFDALRRGVLLAGGGASRPEIPYRLTGRLHAPVRTVPAPRTAAVRGAAELLRAAHAHPSATGVAGPGCPGPR
ncbi:rod shape-determining protein [Streptomyces sp. Tue 6430]|nr:rod shape-determining protein [Streptomyces sp. Tue 6430]